MNQNELTRLRRLEERVRRICEEHSLLTTDILFELVTAQEMLEAMAYHFPINFDHWSHGRDYEKQRTIYDHFGAGIPYEVVWNLNQPRAYLVETNPFALNATILAHVFAHVDFFLGSRYLQRGRSFTDLAWQAQNAAERFAGFEAKYGIEVEHVIDAAMSIQWHQDPDPFADEPDEEKTREYLIKLERARIIAEQRENPGHIPSDEEEAAVAKRFKEISTRTPVQPTYDLLWYIINHSPKPLKPWAKEVLTTIRDQARSLAPNGRTKILNEGWATYWHVRVMHQLKEEGHITAEEFDIFNHFNAGVCCPRYDRLNPYHVGSAFFEYIRRAWDTGRHGREYDECRDPHKRETWNTGANEGRYKIFDIRANYSDRMAVEELFTDDFIRLNQLYIYKSVPDPEDPDQQVLVIAETDPAVVRYVLLKMLTHHGPQVTVENGNYEKKGFLYLRHHDTGYELDPRWRDATLASIRYLWGKHVFLEATDEGKRTLFLVNDKGEIRAREL